MRFSDIVMRAAISGGGASQYGPDLVVNGDFAAGGSWTDSNSRWAISGGKAVHSGLASDYVNTGGTAPAGSVVYECTFTVSNYASGTIQIVVGGTAGTARTANGTFTQNITAGGTTKVTLSAPGLTDLSVDNVTVRRKNF